MPSNEDLPQRHANHSRASWSTRAFEAVLPSDWLVHPLEEDYGIDRRVEVFQNGRTTGVFFNVQLKSTKAGSGHQPADSINRSTLNYWAQTPDATLVVIGHEPTRTLWFRWSHLLPHDENPETKSRQIRCEAILDHAAAVSLGDEAMCWRMARDLSRHLPLDLHVSGNRFYGEGAGPLKQAVSRKVSSLPSFIRTVHSNPRLPHLRVAVEDNQIVAGMRGSFMRPITYDLQGPRPYNIIASDVIAALAFSVADVGAEDLAVRLLKIAAVDSQALFEAQGFGYAVALLTRHGEIETVVTLFRRSVSVEGHPARDIALAAFRSASPDDEARRTIAHEMATAARRWVRPAMGLYNAANVLPSGEELRALDLYDEAASSDARYRTRTYWWREKGVIYWSLGKAGDAEECYREAVKLGDTRAVAYLADVLMRTGRYREARTLFDEAEIWSDSDWGAQWRLSSAALDHIVDDLGVETQIRSTIYAATFDAHHVDDADVVKRSAQAAIHEDAINGFAHAAVGFADERAGHSWIVSTLCAAVITNTNPHLWLNLLRASILDEAMDSETRGAIGRDAMLCAWKYFGASFVDVILDDEVVQDDDLRDEILAFFEHVRPPAPPLELRRHSDGGEFESVFIP